MFVFFPREGISCCSLEDFKVIGDNLGIQIYAVGRVRETSHCIEKKDTVLIYLDSDNLSFMMGPSITLLAFLSDLILETFFMV